MYVSVAGNGIYLFGRFIPLFAIYPIHNNMWLHINIFEGCIIYMGHPESKACLMIKKVNKTKNFFISLLQTLNHLST
jgi:hypothetical protein